MISVTMLEEASAELTLRRLSWGLWVGVAFCKPTLSRFTAVAGSYTTP